MTTVIRTILQSINLNVNHRNFQQAESKHTKNSNPNSTLRFAFPVMVIITSSHRKGKFTTRLSCVLIVCRYNFNSFLLSHVLFVHLQIVFYHPEYESVTGHDSNLNASKWVGREGLNFHPIPVSSGCLGDAGICMLIRTCHSEKKTLRTS